MRISLPALFCDVLAETAVELLLATLTTNGVPEFFDPPAVIGHRTEQRVFIDTGIQGPHLKTLGRTL